MGESALWGDTESLCCSSELTPPPSTQVSCSDTGSFGGETTKRKEEMSSQIVPALFSGFYDLYINTVSLQINSIMLFSYSLTFSSLLWNKV